MKKTKRTDLFSVDFMQVWTPVSGQNKSGQVHSHTSDSQYLHVRYHTVCQPLRPAPDTPARCVSAQTHSRLQLSWHTAGRSPATAAAHLQEPRVKLQLRQKHLEQCAGNTTEWFRCSLTQTGGDKQEVIHIRRVIQIFVGRGGGGGAEGGS